MKQKALLIAEKPDYMRKIQKVFEAHKNELDYEIDFVAQRGHTLTLLDPKEMNPLYKSWDPNYLPIEPENEGGWKYKVIPEEKERFKNIKKHLSSGEYDVVIHAGDSDQEGELLTRLVLKGCNNTLPVMRLWVDADSPNAILKGLKNMKSDDDPFYQHIYNAAIVRQHSDWRFGMNGSRAVASRIHTSSENKIAIGRVMTWVLAIIVFREDEIKNFIPKTSYGVTAEFDNAIKGQLFERETTQNEKGDAQTTDNYVYYDQKGDADQKICELGDTGIVRLFQKKRTKQYSPSLYSLSGAQIDGAKLFGYDSAKVLEIIQSLYEKGYITYPRTDCSCMSSDEDFTGMLHSAESVPELAEIAQHVNNSESIERIKRMEKYVNDKERKEHGHSALSPTDQRPDFDSFSEDEKNIYNMIAKRFIAMFLSPAEFENTNIVIDVNGNLFKASGKRNVSRGYMDFLGISSEDNAIPDVCQGSVLKLTRADIMEHTTTCPKRFNNGTIIGAMQNPKKYLTDKKLEKLENFSVGTPATRSEIIKKLFTDKYVKLDKKSIVPTEWGSFLIHALKNIDITRADMSYKWELILKKLRSGEMEIADAEDIMRKEVKRMIYDISEMEDYTFGDVEDRMPVCKCPDCGGDIISTTKNYFCTGYKNGCKNSFPKSFVGAEFTREDVKKLLSEGVIEKKLKKDGKSWNQKLKFDRKEGRISFDNSSEKTNIKCPICGEMLNKNGSKLECNCGFNLWITIAKKELSMADLQYIIEHGHSKGKIKGFAKKSGGKFSAKLKLKPGKDSGFEFDFTE